MIFRAVTARTFTPVIAVMAAVLGWAALGQARQTGLTHSAIAQTIPRRAGQ